MCKLAQPSTSKGHYAHFRNWAQRIHNPLDPSDGRFPFIRTVSWDNPLHDFIGPMESKTRTLGTSRRHLSPNLCNRIASFDGLVMQGYMMFGNRGLNGFWNSSRRIIIFGWYTWGAVVQVRGSNVDRYVKCDRLRRRHSFPKVILEDTRDIWTRDIRLIERRRILN